MQQRRTRLREALSEQRLDALLITGAANRRYLSGFSGSAGSLLVSADRALLISDFRYVAQAAQEAPGWEFRLLPSGAAISALLPDLLRELGVKRVGFEASDVSVALFRALQSGVREAGVAIEWLATEGMVEQLREVKDAGELDLLRRAIAITDHAFAAVRPLLRPEMREREAAWELEKAMRERGAEKLAFEVIVAAGTNGARPHARAGDDPLGTGCPIVMDFGARVNGYHADMTRTVVLGEADERFWNVYNTVLRAQQAAEDGVRVGMSGRDADALARNLIASAGFGDAFGHGLGHGVGLQIHERPRLAQRNEQPLPAGAVFSVEPGIYLPDWGGVRIEDLALLNDGGAEILTGSSKDPLVEL